MPESYSKDMLQIRRIVGRAMESVRGLDERYPKKKDADDLAEILNLELEFAVEQIMDMREKWKKK